MIINPFIYEPFTPLKQNAKHWYDGQDLSTITKDVSDFVSQWNDKSIFGANLTQATAAEQPKYIAPDGLTGDGTTDRMLASAACKIDSSLNFTIAFWYKGQDDGSTLNIPLGIGASNNGLTFDFNDASIGLLAFWESSGGKRVDAGTALEYLDNTWRHFMLVKRGATDTELYINNVSVDTSTDIWNASPNLLNTDINVFGHIDNSAYSAKGSLQHIVMIQKDLNAAEREQLYNFDQP